MAVYPDQVIQDTLPQEETMADPKWYAPHEAKVAALKVKVDSQARTIEELTETVEKLQKAQAKNEVKGAARTRRRSNHKSARPTGTRAHVCTVPDSEDVHGEEGAWHLPAELKACWDRYYEARKAQA